MGNTRQHIEDLFEEVTDPISQRYALNSRDAYHLTALHYAVKYSHLEIVRLLLEKGAGENRTFSESKFEPLFTCSKSTKETPEQCAKSV